MPNGVRSSRLGPPLLAALLAAGPVQAQVVTDGSVGRRESLSGPAVEIGADLGTRRGDNLFLTDHGFHDIGLPDQDIGRGKFLPLVSMMHAFKNPTLRDVARRAPYMHNGSLTDLNAVVEHYNKGGIARPSLSGEMKPLGLTADEKNDLVTFMLTLTGDAEPVQMPPLAMPAQMPSF